MAESDFDVVFEGRVVEGADPSQVKANIAKLFRTDAEKVERIKRSLTKGVSINATAKKLKVGVATVHRVKQQMALAA